MPEAIVVEGPVSDLLKFRTELIDELDNEGIIVGQPYEKRPGILDNDELGSSALGEFMIQFAATVSATAVTAAAKIATSRIERWARLRLRRESDESDS